MSGRRPGTCGEPGPYAAHCTLDRMHDHSCYDGGEDVSWNHNQWYDFDLAPHDCGDETCPDAGYRGPPGRESEYESTAPTARDLADATDISDFLVPGSTFSAQEIGIEPGPDFQAPTMALDSLPTSYEIPISVFRYEPTERDPDVWDQVFGGGASLIWVYSEGQCLGSLQVVDGEWESFPLTQVWEGDQA